MIKRETFQLLSMIQGYYDQFEVDQVKLDLWHEALKVYELEDLKKSLLTYVLHSAFPPKVADLVFKPTVGTAIPNLEETKEIVTKDDQPVNAERIQWHLANIRKALGMEWGDKNGRI